jgi:NADPH:quinone reductase-like Zn-dependent oxidoreductase
VVTDDAVLVQVHAAAVGKGDWLTVQGLPYVARLRYGLPKPKHPVPGFDVAGRIEAVGPNVTLLQPGDAVFGWSDGSFAQYASVPQGQLVLKPGNLTFEQAAAVPISGLAALQALRDTGEVQPGQQVVVIGASAGVGSFAVQLAKAFGAKVTGVCSTKSADLVQSIGADHVIDYTQQDFTPSWATLRPDPGDGWEPFPGRSPARPHSQGDTGAGGRIGWPVVHGDRPHPPSRPGVPVRRPAAALVLVQAKGSDLVVLKELLEAGKLTPVIDQTFPLSETAEAIRYVGERSTQGKTVITV